MRKILFLSVLLLCSVNVLAQDAFTGAGLTDRTLRIDYIFSGTDKTCDIALGELMSFDGWAGRRVNLDVLPVRGNGSITMKDSISGKILFCNSFCTLFQEWQATEEATRVRKSFENVFLLPMPSSKVDICVELYDFHNNVASSFTHSVDPSDILIRKLGKVSADTRYILKSGDPSERIDVAILAEGYTASEMNVFYADAAAAVGAIISHEPFASMQDRFNFIAVGLESKDSGVSIPKQDLWLDTALGSSFDTFYMDRYLTTLKLNRVHDSISGLPYEHIVILANTKNYGGGGIYNSYTLTTAHHKSFRPVVVHEFGHSFGALADEYYYDDQFVEYYYPDVEPWERNITTMADFQSKWKGMIDEGTPVPTPAGSGIAVGLYEGGGYQSKGVFRASEDCRMKTNAAPAFCPVCRRAIIEMIKFNTEENNHN